MKFKDIQIKEFISLEQETSSPKEFIYFVLVFKDDKDIQQQLSIMPNELEKLKSELNKLDFKNE